MIEVKRDAKILLGIPSVNEDDRFLASLNNLVKEAKSKYQLSILTVKDEFLPKAQNDIVDYFLSKDFDYLIFLDDDHSGHCVGMIDALIATDAYVATIKTFSRHYPYPCCLMEKRSIGGAYAYFSVDQDSGARPVDFVGFPMTLIRRNLFDLLPQPFFFGGDYGDGRAWTSDRGFCECLAKLGIRPVGVFDYCLNHGDITKDNVMHRRMREISDGENRMKAYVAKLKGEFTCQI